MKILDLYQDYNIPLQTEGKNCSPGWINTNCPFCKDSNFHLGYNPTKDYFKCWRCGWHPLGETIAALMGSNLQEANHAIKQYGGASRAKEPKSPRPRTKAHKLPSGAGPLQRRHYKYLEKRGFDSDKITREWNLLGTGPVSLLGQADYKHRILAPIIWDREQVSFQTRDITNKAKLKYKACLMKYELIHHQEILYGKQNEWGDTGICVEGITDVWRLGAKAFAIFGMEFTTQQVKAIIQAKFKRVIVLFDNEPQADKQALKLVSELNFAGVKAFKMTVLNGDPAAMKQDDADNLVRELTR